LGLNHGDPVSGNPKVAFEEELGIMAGSPKKNSKACLRIFEKNKPIKIT
jgi:hypothetical protein